MPRRFTLILLPVFTVVAIVFLSSLMEVFGWKIVHEDNLLAIFLPAFLYAAISCYLLTKRQRGPFTFHWFFWWGLLLIVTALFQTLKTQQYLRTWDYADAHILSFGLPWILLAAANVGTGIALVVVAALGDLLPRGTKG